MLYTYAKRNLPDGSIFSVAEAVILFDEQRTAISLKRAVPLFVAEIAILFIRIGEQIAEIALFLFSIRFGRSRIDEQRGLFVPHETNRRIEEQRFPPFFAPLRAF